MQPYQTLNGRTLYEPCLPDGEGHHQCVGTDDEACELLNCPVTHDGATGHHKCACTCHLGVIVTVEDNRPDETGDPEGDQRYREAAHKRYHRDGEIEIDLENPDSCRVSYSHNHAPNEPCNIPGSADPEGAYVAAWVWVTAEDAEEEEQK